MKDGQTLSTLARLRALADFLPRLEAPDFNAGKWSGINGKKRGELTLPDFFPSPAVNEFIKSAYKFGWVRDDFDWPEWITTPESTRLCENPRALAEATREQLARLLTAIIRRERFCPGTINGAFKDGLLTGICRRAACLAEEAAADKS